MAFVARPYAQYDTPLEDNSMLSQDNTDLSRSTSSHKELSKKEVREIIATASSNEARGNAVQINGHVAGVIMNNLGSITINYHQVAASLPIKAPRKATEPAKLTVQDTSVVTKRVAELKRPTSEFGRDSQAASIAARSQIIPPQDLVFASTDGRRHVVRAVYRLDVVDNFVSHRIVTRLNLSSKTEKLDDKPPTPQACKEYVVIACCARQGSIASIHRFVVVSDCTFDVLFGAASIKHLGATLACREKLTP